MLDLALRRVKAATARSKAADQRVDAAVSRWEAARRRTEAALARSEAAGQRAGRLDIVRDATADERERVADERDATADERERVADERDATADERERIADERDVAADQREETADRRQWVANERDARDRARANENTWRVTAEEELAAIDRVLEQGVAFRTQLASSAERLAERALRLATVLEEHASYGNDGFRRRLAQVQREIASVERRNAEKLREAGSGPLRLERLPALPSDEEGDRPTHRANSDGVFG